MRTDKEPPVVLRLKKTWMNVNEMRKLFSRRTSASWIIRKERVLLHQQKFPEVAELHVVAGGDHADKVHTSGDRLPVVIGPVPRGGVESRVQDFCRERLHLLPDHVIDRDIGESRLLNRELDGRGGVEGVRIVLLQREPPGDEVALAFDRQGDRTTDDIERCDGG